MANKERGEVSFKARNKTWTLRYSANALCELEDATGKNAMVVAQEMNDPETVRIKTLRAMFWAGLTDNHDLDEKQAGELMSEIGFGEAGELIGKAFQSVFGEAGDDASEGKPKRE